MKNSPRNAPRRPHIAQLDGLRAVAILMVVVSHIVGTLSHPTLASFGYLGVTIFFALSGYLITSHLLDEYESTGEISLQQFYARRFFRILPPALFYLSIVGILAGLGLVHCEWSALKAALFFYANYREDYYRTGWMIGHFWSLSVEEHFYLVWPTLLILLGVARGWRTASLLALSIAILRIVDDRHHFLGALFHNPDLGHFHSDLVADVILWGCCAAYYMRRKGRVVAGPWVWDGLTVIAFFLLLAPTVFGIPHTTIAAHLLPAVLLVSVLSSPTGLIARVLCLSPLRWIGKLSYSIYLWQTLFLSGPEPHLEIVLALGAILGCALLSYTCIEQPFIRLGRGLIQRRVPAIA